MISRRCPVALNDSRTELQLWLTERIADLLDLPAHTLEPDVPLSEYGMDSVYSLTICAVFEDELGVPVDPLAVWDHPEIGLLCDYLYQQVGAPGTLPS
jgi:acyl carrier protein